MNELIEALRSELASLLDDQACDEWDDGYNTGVRAVARFIDRYERDHGASTDTSTDCRPCAEDCERA